MSVLSVQNLSKRFGALVAVDDVSFELGNGEILGLLGPNGAGKTTTIQMLLAVLTPTRGRVSYFGLDLAAHREEILERVNFSSTYTNLPWNLAVKDNLHFLVYLYAVPDRKRRYQELVERFRLGALLNKKVVTLSAGEMTRLNLAKAFVNNPEVLLLDEPTASLDPEAAMEVRRYIQEQRAERQMAVLFTSHNMAEVEMMCDRVIFINHGKVVADGTPAALARALDRCSLSLRVEETSRTAFEALCVERGVKILIDSGEYSVELREREVPAFLQLVVNRSVEFFNLSVTPASLEDFFLAQAGTRSTPAAPISTPAGIVATAAGGNASGPENNRGTP